jgi:hypothetical protein
VEELVSEGRAATCEVIMAELSPGGQR